MRLAGKAALITGNSSGLGRAASVLFAQEGAVVAGCGRSKKRGEETVRAVEEVGGRALFVEGDISRRSDVEHVVEVAREEFGRIDILVNNAGVSFAGDGSNLEALLDVTEAGFDRLIDINLKGAFHALSVVLPVMIDNGGGTIVNVGSAIANLGMPMNHVYSAAKAGMASLTRSIAVTYSAQNIRINTLIPGAFESPMAEGFGDVVDLIKPIINPKRRFAELSEIAYPMLFLASDESSFVNGQELVVDGGQAIQALPPMAQ